MSTPAPIALVLRRRGITTKELADRIGYSETHVSRVVYGRHPGHPLLRALLAEELELPVDELFEPEPESAAS